MQHNARAHRTAAGALILVLTTIALLGFPSALAGGEAQLLALRADDHPADNAWSTTLEELRKTYPFVATAIENAGTVHTLTPEQLAEVDALFAHLHESGHGAILIDGVPYTLEVTIGSHSGDGDVGITSIEGAPTDLDDDEAGITSNDPAKESPAGALVLLIGGLLALLGAARRQ